MKIEKGLMPGQVLQRDQNNKGSADIKGTCKANGTVQYRLIKSPNNKTSAKWIYCGNAVNKEFNFRIDKIPTGGPYSLEFKVNKGSKTIDKLDVQEIFVGDVWICAGQSNMEGVGNLKHAPQEHEKVRAFYMRDEWDIAKSKIHFLSEAVDIVHNDYGSGPKRPSDKQLDKDRAFLIKGLSPANSFALDMYKRTKVPQGLIACAHGGTSMGQWSPALKNKEGASLYGAMMRRYAKLGQKVAGVIWYQGESEAGELSTVKKYTQNMVDLIESTRKDTGIPNLPWGIVQLGCHTADDPDNCWNKIQEQQRNLLVNIKYCDVVPAVDLDLDDGIHISGSGQNQLGKRLARVMNRIVHKNLKSKASIQIKNIELVKCPDTYPKSPIAAIKINFSNVNGSLKAEGKPSGFTVMNNNGVPFPCIYKVTLHKNYVLLHTNEQREMLETMHLSYGLGRHPYCNIVDSENMSLPTFFNVKIFENSAPFCLKWQSAFLKSNKTISGVKANELSKKYNWSKAPLRKLGPMVNLGVVVKRPSKEKTGVYLLKTNITAKEDLDIMFHYGLNVPFVFWFNNKSMMKDLSCGAPIAMNKYTATLKLKKGTNTVYFALQVTGPQDRYGVCGRFTNLDMQEEKRISIST
jgi:hypothetical protein